MAHISARTMLSDLESIPWISRRAAGRQLSQLELVGYLCRRAGFGAGRDNLAAALA